jgi:hypothetical protein
MPCHIEECQFQVPESQLISDFLLFEGTMPAKPKNYCRFHAPEDIKKNWSNENKEPVNLSNVVFPSVINFMGRDF